MDLSLQPMDVGIWQTQVMVLEKSPGNERLCAMLLRGMKAGFCVHVCFWEAARRLVRGLQGAMRQKEAVAVGIGQHKNHITRITESGLVLCTICPDYC